MADFLKGIGDIPINVDNEAAIISNAINDIKNREIFLKRVHYLDFRMREYQSLAHTIYDLDQDNVTEMNIDLLLSSSSRNPIRQQLDREFIENLINNYSVVPEPNFLKYLDILNIDKVRSEIAELTFSSLYKSLMDPASEISDIAERMRLMQEVLEKGAAASRLEFKNMTEVMDDFYEYKTTKVNFRTTGFRQLDTLLTDGLMDGKITTICALPSAGKSSFTLSMMKNLSNRGVYTAQFALEMPNISLATKLLAFNTRFSIKRIATNWDSFSVDEKKRFEYEFSRLRDNKFIYLNDKPSQSLQQIREQVVILQDRLKEQYIVVAIDLFGKIRDLTRSSNFAMDYEKLLNEAQIMTRSLGIHLVPVAQINRGATKRKNIRPKMSDLKNAGAWEEVSDTMFGIYRENHNPEVALRNQIAYGLVGSPEAESVDPNDNIAEVIILKSRMGVNNRIVYFYFDPVTTRFSPIDEDYQAELIANSSLNTNNEDDD